MIATAAFKETVDSIAGHPSRDTSFAAALIVLAVLAHSFRPAVRPRLRKSVRAVITRGSQTPGLVRSPGVDDCRKKS